MKRGLGFNLAVFMLIGFRAGCSGENKAEAEKTQDGKIVVDFWTFWGSETRHPIM